MAEDRNVQEQVARRGRIMTVNEARNVVADHIDAWAEVFLRETRPDLDPVFENVGPALLDLYADYTPERAEQTSGIDARRLREVAELIIPPSLREAHRDGLSRYLKTGRGPIVGRRVELTAMRRDGTEEENPDDNHGRSSPSAQASGPPPDAGGDSCRDRRTVPVFVWCPVPGERCPAPTTQALRGRGGAGFF